jgi:endonuclease-3
MTPARREAMFAALRAANPEPQGELDYASPFQLLVAVVLSAQATDKSVNAATRRLFPLAGTPQAMLALGEARLADTIRTIGLYRNKARHVIGLCQQLLQRHGGEVPQTRTELEALPGVGRKTANVVLNIAFGQETIAVDTHCFRVANRTGLAPGKTVEAVEAKLMKAVPPAYRLHAHHWLILHGRYVCLARQPRCQDCLIRSVCAYPDKTR